MGKTQSKRSVDITTDSKMVSKESDFPDKMEKIADIMEQNEVNGDTIMAEKGENNPDIKNCKDLSSENNDETTCVVGLNQSGERTEDGQAIGDTDTGAAKDNATGVENAPNQNQVVGNGGGGDTTADGSLKKFKMEKVKKKWSFRSISFGKKDKQKPIKNEEISENAAVVAVAATNGIADGVVTNPIKENEENNLAVKTADDETTANNKNEEQLQKDNDNEKDQEEGEEEKSVMTQSEVNMETNNKEQVLDGPSEHSKDLSTENYAVMVGKLLTPEENTDVICNDNNLSLSENTEMIQTDHTAKEEERKTIIKGINGNGDSSTNMVEMDSKVCIENGSMDNCQNISNENIPAISAIVMKIDEVSIKENCKENNMQQQLNGPMDGELHCEMISEHLNAKQIKEEIEEEENIEMQGQEETTLGNEIDKEMITSGQIVKGAFNQFLVDEQEGENKCVANEIASEFPLKLHSEAIKNDIESTLNTLDMQINAANQSEIMVEINVPIINNDICNDIIALENECNDSNKECNDSNNKVIRVVNEGGVLEKIDRNSIEETGRVLVTMENDAKEEEKANCLKLNEDKEQQTQMEIDTQLNMVLQEQSTEIVEKETTNIDPELNKYNIDANSLSITVEDLVENITFKAMEIVSMTENEQEQQPNVQSNEKEEDEKLQYEAPQFDVDVVTICENLPDQNQDISHAEDLKDCSIINFNNAAVVDMETPSITMDEKIVSDNVAVAIAADSTTDQMQMH